MKTLVDRVVVVTGATGGLGQALCRRLAHGGANLALVDLAEGPLQEAAEQLQKLGAKVQIQHTARGKGKLVLNYNSLQELDGILEHIK